MVHAPLIMFNLQQLGLKSKRAKSNRAGRDLMWPFVSKCNYRCSISNIMWLHFLSLCWGNRNEHRYLATKKSIIVLFSQFSHSVVSNSLQPHGLQHTRLPCPSPTPETYSKSSIKSVMPSNRLILCCPLLLLPSIFSSIRVFSNESVLHIRWPNYWSFTFSISPSNECSWLVSFRIDWLDLLAVQGTLKILLQHHSSEA